MVAYGDADDRLMPPAVTRPLAALIFCAAMLFASPVGSGVRPLLAAAGSALPVLTSAVPAMAPPRGHDATRRVSPRDPVGPVVVASAAPLSNLSERAEQGRVEPRAPAGAAREGEGTLPALLGALMLVGWIVSRRRG
jgi:hypothetical protein